MAIFGIAMWLNKRGPKSWQHEESCGLNPFMMNRSSTNFSFSTTHSQSNFLQTQLSFKMFFCLTLFCHTVMYKHLCHHQGCECADLWHDQGQPALQCGAHSNGSSWFHGNMREFQYVEQLFCGQHEPIPVTGALSKNEVAAVGPTKRHWYCFTLYFGSSSFPFLAKKTMRILCQENQYLAPLAIGRIDERLRKGPQKRRMTSCPIVCLRFLRTPAFVSEIPCQANHWRYLGDCVIQRGVRILS